MEIDYLSVGKRIKYFRTMRNISQKTLSETVGLERAYIAHIELGEKNPSLETLVSIANALQVSMDDLLIDSIETTEKHDNEVDYVLLDCTPGEVKILTKNLKSLRETLREFQVK